MYNEDNLPIEPDAGQVDWATLQTHETAESERQNGFFSDSLGQYLAEIGKTPLLSAEEEVELIEAIDRGDEQAYEDFVTANLRLVVYVARHEKFKAKHMDLEDLISEGNFGLMRALETFDPAQGYKFSTYATYWIRHYIDRGIGNQDRAIRVPIHVLEKVFKVSRVERDFHRENDRQPTEEEIAAELDWPAEELKRLQTMSLPLLSLDMPIGEDGTTTLLETLPTQVTANTVEDEIVHDDSVNKARGLIFDILETFNEKQRFVLEQRYGLRDGQPKTLDEVGAELGITRERVRQIQRKVEDELLPAIRLYAEDTGFDLSELTG